MMAVKKTVDRKSIEVLPPRMHIDEFLKVFAQLTEMEVAGFKVFVKKEWMRRQEWQEALETYKERK